MTFTLRAQPTPIFVYLLNRENRQRWLDEQRFIHHGPGSVIEFTGPVVLPHDGPWWLLIENRTETPIDLHVNYTVDAQAHA